MQQQLPVALRIVIDIAAVAVGVDVHVVEPDLAALDARVAVAKIRLALPNAFHLGAAENDAGLEGVEDVVVEERLAIVGNEGLALTHRISRAIAHFA